MSFAEKHYHHGVVKVTLDEGWAVEIEKLEYTPLVRLLSIPATEAAAPDEVLDELRGLELPEDEPTASPPGNYSQRLLSQSVRDSSPAIRRSGFLLPRSPNHTIKKSGFH